MSWSWELSIPPIELQLHEKNDIIELFLEETDEIYSIHSLNCLQIPKWEGNVVLKNEDKQITGVFWSHPVGLHTVRIAAFVLHRQFQNKGIGSNIWQHMIDTFQALGFKEIILEVRADNEQALSFYQQRGMNIIRTLEGYYSAGLGYSMKGDLRPQIGNEISLKI